MTTARNRAANAVWNYHSSHIVTPGAAKQIADSASDIWEPLLRDMVESFESHSGLQDRVKVINEARDALGIGYVQPEPEQTQSTPPSGGDIRTAEEVRCQMIAEYWQAAARPESPITPDHAWRATHLLNGTTARSCLPWSSLDDPA